MIGKNTYDVWTKKEADIANQYDKKVLKGESISYESLVLNINGNRYNVTEMVITLLLFLV